MDNQTASQAWEHVQLASRLAINGNCDKAIEECNAALNLDKTCAQAWYQRGNCYNIKGKTYYDQAIQDFTQAINCAREGDNLANYHIWRGMTYESKRDYASALEDYAKAIELDPDKPAYKNMYKDTEAKLAKKKGGKKKPAATAPVAEPVEAPVEARTESKMED